MDWYEDGEELPSRDDEYHIFPSADKAIYYAYNMTRTKLGKEDDPHNVYLYEAVPTENGGYKFVDEHFLVSWIGADEYIKFHKPVGTKRYM